MGPGHVTFCFSFQFFIHYGFCILFSVNQWMLVSQHAWYCCYCSRCFWCFNKAWRNRKPLYSLCPGERSPSRKIGLGCETRFPKPLPYLWPKSPIFPTLFMTWKRMSFFKNHTQFLTGVQKPCPFTTNGQNLYPIYNQNVQNPYPLGPHIPI